jgi:hypothetical protein
MPKRIRPRPLSLITGLTLVIGASPTLAGDADPNFGNRTDKPDGSAALTIGRRLPTEWDTKVGTDVSLAAPPAAAPSENFLRGASTDRSTGAIWGNLTMPGVRSLGFDKTSVEARVDAGKDEGKLGATLSRSVPVSEGLSVTLQNSTSIRQSLASGTPATPGLPLATNAATAAAPTTAPGWAVDQTIRLSLNPYGTTFSAGAGSSTADTQWHNKLSVEQMLFGPLKLTTSIEDAGTTASTKSITAGFKKTW